MRYCLSPYLYQRRKTREVVIGDPARGGVAFRVTSAADAEQLDILGLDPSAKDTPPGWQETAASASR